VTAAAHAIEWRLDCQAGGVVLGFMAQLKKHPLLLAYGFALLVAAGGSFASGSPVETVDGLLAIACAAGGMVLQAAGSWVVGRLKGPDPVIRQLEARLTDARSSLDLTREDLRAARAKAEAAMHGDTALVAQLRTTISEQRLLIESLTRDLRTFERIAANRPRDVERRFQSSTTNAVTKKERETLSGLKPIKYDRELGTWTENED